MADNYFSSAGEFERQQQKRRQRMTQTFFDKQTKEIRKLLLDSCRQELIDLNIHIHCEQNVQDQVENDRLLALQISQDDEL